MSALQSAGLTQYGGGKKMGPPPSDVVANHMAERVESGESTAEELLTELETKFGDQASAVFAEDGSVDVEALTDLIDSNRSTTKQAADSEGNTETASQRGGLLQQASTVEELQSLLTERFGEESTNTVINDDGTINFDELVSLVKPNQGYNAGLMLDTST